MGYPLRNRCVLDLFDVRAIFWRFKTTKHKWYSKFEHICCESFPTSGLFSTQINSELTPRPLLVIKTTLQGYSCPQMTGGFRVAV